MSKVPVNLGCIAIGKDDASQRFVMFSSLSFPEGVELEENGHYIFEILEKQLVIDTGRLALVDRVSDFHSFENPRIWDDYGVLFNTKMFIGRVKKWRDGSYSMISYSRQEKNFGVQNGKIVFIEAGEIDEVMASSEWAPFQNLVAGVTAWKQAVIREGMTRVD